jgi:hypothetical protein
MPKWPTGPCRAFAISSAASIRGLLTTRLEDDELDILDLESIVLTGEIVERQTDHRTGEAKYVIRDITLANSAGGVVAKFDSVGRAWIITVYLE